MFLWTSLTLMVCIIYLAGASDDTEARKWLQTPMPKESMFEGFPVPTNSKRWKIAAERAAKGTHVLLFKVAKDFRMFEEGIERDFNYETEFFCWLRSLADVELGYSGFRQIKSFLHKRYHSSGISPMHSFEKTDKFGVAATDGAPDPASRSTAKITTTTTAATATVTGATVTNTKAHTPAAANAGHEHWDWVASTFEHALHGDITHIKHAVAHKERGTTKIPLILMGSIVVPVNHNTDYRAGVVELAAEYNASKGVHIQSWYSGLEGPDFDPFSPSRLVDLYSKEGRPRKTLFAEKVVLMGAMNENWGWMSSWFPNRTAAWGVRFSDSAHPLKSAWPLEEIRPLLDDPNVEAIIVNGHTNVSHPKVVSMPLGLPDSSLGIFAHNRAVLNDSSAVPKDRSLFYAGSDFGIRPYIFDCIYDHLSREPGMNMSRFLRLIPLGKKVHIPNPTPISISISNSNSSSNSNRTPTPDLTLRCRARTTSTN